jgi:hypothetical protein
MITLPSFPDPRFIRGPFFLHDWPPVSADWLTPILDIGRIHSFLPLTPETLKTEN